MIPDILVAGIGNIFLGDDAFGCDVIRRLLEHPHPESVRIFDFGIRGFDLIYALLDGPEHVILIDATMRGEAPGTLYVIEPELADEPRVDQALLNAHGMEPVKVLRIARSMGGQFRHVLLVGCEPESFGSEDDGEGRMGLSAPVAAAVEEAVRTVESLIANLQFSDREENDKREKIEVT